MWVGKSPIPSTATLEEAELFREKWEDRPRKKARAVEGEPLPLQ